MADVRAAVSTPTVLGVAGTPTVVANSLSPQMMRAAFEALGLDAYYVPLAVREKSAAKALRGLPRLGFAGCNVTMPYKPLAASIAHSRSASVERSGVANTLVVRADGTLHAEATDGLAVVDAIMARDIPLRGARVAMIGAGGVATDAALALVDAGVARIDVWNRTRATAEQLVQRLGDGAPDVELRVHDRLPIRDAPTVVVSCVPAEALEPRMLETLHPDSLVVDLAYRRDGRPTPLVAAVGGDPERAVDGRELLVRQGAASFHLWFGLEAPVPAMLDAVAPAAG